MITGLQLVKGQNRQRSDPLPWGLNQIPVLDPLLAPKSKAWDMAMVREEKLLNMSKNQGKQHVWTLKTQT